MDSISKRLSKLSPEKQALFKKMLLQKRMAERQKAEQKQADQHFRNKEESEKKSEDFGYSELTPAEYENFLLTHSWEASDIEDIYPLSPMQEGLLFHSLYEPDSSMHCEQVSYHISGNFQRDNFISSWQELGRRHAILRTAFAHKNLSRPLQVVLGKRDIPVTVETLTSLSETDQQQHIDNYLKQDKEKPFDLTHGALTRIAIFCLKEDSYHVIWTYHSLLLDGWSMSVLFRELIHIYEKLSRNEAPDISSPVPFRTYIEWLNQQNREASKIYWTRYLSEYEETASLPAYTSTATGTPGYQLKEMSFTLPGETSESLRSLIRQGVTLSTVFQTIWSILLSRYNGTNDVVFGTIVSGRPTALKGTEDIVGLFVNAIPVRIRTSADQPFSDVLKTVQKEALESERHQYLSLAEIQAECSGLRELSDHLLFFENVPLGQELMQGWQGGEEGISVSQIEIYEQFSNYDFNVIIIPDKDIRILFSYNENVYPQEQMERLADHLRAAIQSVLENPERPVGSINILPEAERNQVIHEFNDTAADYPSHRTIVDLFEKQVEKTPDNTAVIFGETKLTYRELNEQANRVAHSLRDKYHVQPDARVGLCLERSEWMIIGVFGILKAGGAYVPVSPDYPESRVQYILSDSGCSVLLTREKYIGKASLLGLSDVIDIREIREGRTDNPVPVYSSRNLAYVIYTSGSTGQPKGVMIEHHSVLNRILWMHKSYPLDEKGVILQKTPFTFDVSVWELFWWSFVGSGVCMLKPGGEKDPAEIVNAIEKYGITTIHFVPSMFNAFLRYVKEQACSHRVSSLRHVFASGEALTSRQISLFNFFIRGATLHNLYGPTEATVDVSYFDCSPFSGGDVVPIGKPIDNTRLYVLDQNDTPVPIGVIGELCIAGVNVGRGYLNKPELTEEKFVPDPFHPGERMYRTGDLCRWLPDGNIEYLGRNDFQVKIRGFRIELGEIENRLSSYGPVQDSVVVAREIQDDYVLAAYMTGKEELSISKLRDHLKAGLPEYMIPSYFVQLESLPLNQSGKTDRKALPDPFETGMGPETEYIAPRNEAEEKLAAICQEVLGIEKVGIQDNFFELGGHSLKATQVVSRIHKEFGAEITLQAFFNKPTIEKLARDLRDAKPAEYEAIASLEGIAPASDEELMALKQMLEDDEGVVGC
ncbi:amino acid adenylation domain-containing protein [Desulfobacterales bacterium HSG2]|nr:amino acid adenylation domain-containing protein [Desulfobacterales bacterium HSG2]